MTHPVEFDKGAEFPGANGHSEVVDGELKIAYDFSGGGHYVRAAVPLPERPTVGMVRFEANFDHTTQLTLRFTDATGQVFQQLLRGTTEGWGEWTVSLGSVSTHWGGSNDGILHQPITKIAFLAENLTSTRGGPRGILSVRNIRLQKTGPVPAAWSSERSIGDLMEEVDSLRAKLQAPVERGSAKARATWAVLETFRPWVERDIAKGWTERAKRELLEMRRIAADELARLDRVDRGEETDAPVPRFVTSPVETRGADLVADRVWPDGRRERGRVFLNGFGHFRQAQDAVGRFQELGNNYLQMEIGPWDILKDENAVDLAVLDQFRVVADNCASNNVKICLLVSPHYFPKWALEKWPDLKGCGWGFFKYCVHDERAWDVLEKYLRVLIPRVKDHPALHSICLSNEPVQAYWGSNCVLRTEWKGPVMKSCWDPEPTKDTLDFCRFNRRKFGAFHRRLAALVHELAPGLPVHAKIMVWQEFENGPTYHSVDLQEFSELSDLNGNDAEDYPFPDGDGVWAHRWWDMEAGYDWQRSSRDAPILNSENHIIPDHSRAYVPGNHLYTVLWQNTLHGQAATALWMWERTYNPKSMANGLVLERPECLNAWAHCALDVSRLADLLSPIRNQKPTILLYWSLASQILSGRRGHYFLACYRAAAFLGQPLGIVTDETLGAFGRDGRLVRPLEEARVVLLPNFNHLEPETLAGLRRLADSGVKVKRCEDSERALFRRMCEEMGSWGLPDLPRVREPGSERGVFGVESRGCRVNGKPYLSLVNHTTGALRVRLESAGRDLITGAKVPQEFDIRPMTPMFVECETQPSARVKYLDEFDLSSMSCGMGVRPQARKTILEKPLRLGERTFERGVGTHSESLMLFRANGKVKAFDAVVGVDRETQDYPDSWRTRKNYGSCSFRVYADWRKVCDSGVLKEKDPPKAIHADLAGATNILIECTDGGHWAGYMCGHGDWADARFTLDDGAEIAPVADDPRLGQLGILTPPIPEAPRINGPAVWGVRPGHPVIYRVPVSGKRPMKLSVAGLPDGATFDPQKGIIGGCVASAGDYVCRIMAENAFGRAARDFTLKVGEAIALTPPMGWNSWNIYSKKVTDAKVRAIARAMDETGLADHGWAYVNVDDWWMKNPGAAKDNPAHAGPVRDGKGRFIPQAVFPDMKALGDYIHSLGFRFGIYSSPGAKTCGGCEGSLGHEEIDARTWADWGVDYLKHDWCSYWDVFNAETKGRKPEVDDYAKPYRLMSKCLRAQDRDIVHAFCQYGIGDVQTWGREAGAQVWRSWGDLKDNWTSILNSIDSYAEAWKHTGPGFWCDPDMMVIGRLGDFGGHDSFLSHNEQYTHMSLWCLLNAPLLLGCDLTQLDDFTKGLVVNDEVLAVNQDTLGRQAQRVRRTDDTEIWWRPLADGSSAAGLVNRYPFTRTVEFRFMEAGQSGEFWVKDLWRQRCLGRHRDSIAVEVPGHATVLLKMVRGDCASCEGRKEDGKSDAADWAVRLNGRALKVESARCSAMPVNIRWPGHQRFLDQTEVCAFVRFDITESSVLEFEAPRAFTNLVVRPRSKDAEAVRDGRTIRLTLKEPGAYSVELDGRHRNLLVFADRPRDFKVDRSSPDVRYFGPGEHEPGLIEMTTGETLFIDEGAVVYGRVQARDADRIRIVGRGILDGSRVKEMVRKVSPEEMAEYRRKGWAIPNVRRFDAIRLDFCDDVEISGITIRDSPLYTIRPVCCDRLRIEGVKIVGNWRYNSDGIDMHNCRDVAIRDCFIRTFDDSICVKGFDYVLPESDMLHDGILHDSFENVLVEGCVIWTDWGRSLEIGAETRGRLIRNVTFRDCDVIFRQGFAMDVQNCDQAEVRDVVFENIRVEDDGGIPSVVFSEHVEDFASANPDVTPPLAGAVIHYIPEYSKAGAENRGRIRGVAFRDISVTGPRLPGAVLKGFDADHRVEDVVFSRIRLNGTDATESFATGIVANAYAPYGDGKQQR